MRYLLLRKALKQALAGEQLHHDHGKAVHVGRARHLALLQELWRHVRSRACHAHVHVLRIGQVCWHSQTPLGATASSCTRHLFRTVHCEAINADGMSGDGAACSPYVKVETWVAFASNTRESPKSAICIAGTIVRCMAASPDQPSFSVQNIVNPKLQWKLTTRWSVPCTQTPACRRTSAQWSSVGRLLPSHRLFRAQPQHITAGARAGKCQPCRVMPATRRMRMDANG